MAVFVDTGILLRSVHRTDPFYPEVRSAIRKLIEQNTPVFTGLQQLAEFWNVSTRPPGQRSGFGLSSEEAGKRLRRIDRGVKVLTESPVTPVIWRALVQKYGVKGVAVRDARTAALMLTHSLNLLVTLNQADFTRYEPEGLRPMTPAQFVAAPA